MRAAPTESSTWRADAFASRARTRTWSAGPALTRLCGGRRPPAGAKRAKESSMSSAAETRGMGLRGALDTTAVARDLGIPGIARALDFEAAARWLEPHLARLATPPGRVRLRSLRAVRHKPGRRCLIEYELDVERRGTPAECIVVLGKMRSRGLDHATLRLVETLWKRAFSDSSPDRISVPE